MICVYSNKTNEKGSANKAVDDNADADEDYGRQQVDYGGLRVGYKKAISTVLEKVSMNEVRVKCLRLG